MIDPKTVVCPLCDAAEDLPCVTTSYRTPTATHELRTQIAGYMARYYPDRLETVVDAEVLDETAEDALDATRPTRIIWDLSARQRIILDGDGLTLASGDPRIEGTDMDALYTKLTYARAAAAAGFVMVPR